MFNNLNSNGKLNFPIQIMCTKLQSLNKNQKIIWFIATTTTTKGELNSYK